MTRRWRKGDSNPRSPPEKPPFERQRSAEPSARTALRLARRPFEQRDAAPAHPFCDGVAEEPHDPRQVDLDAHHVVQHLDPAGDPLPHCRRRKVQGVPFPAVIEPAEKSIELGPKTDDAAVRAGASPLAGRACAGSKRAAVATWVLNLA